MEPAMTDSRRHPRTAQPHDEGDHVDLARNRIAALLNRDDQLHLGMAIFDLWAAFDELIDPLFPSAAPQPVWIEEPAQAMRDAHADLMAAVEAAPTPSAALSLGRAAHNVANALATLERSR
jgi:hypothetical protein